VPVHKDVIVAILGASSGFAGLVLVFLGFVLTAYQGLGTPVPKRVKARYQRLALSVSVAFLLAIVCVALSVCWLLLRHPAEVFYTSTVAVFFAQLVSLVGTAGFAIRRLFD
jgi:hypothetical protein